MEYLENLYFFSMLKQEITVIARIINNKVKVKVIKGGEFYD
jgi:hypothetical protein